MSYLESDHLSRAEALGATDEGFCAWMLLEYKFIVTPDRLERWKNKKWKQYLDALEDGELVARQDFRSIHP